MLSARGAALAAPRSSYDPVFPLSPVLATSRQPQQQYAPVSPSAPTHFSIPVPPPFPSPSQRDTDRWRRHPPVTTTAAPPSPRRKQEGAWFLTVVVLFICFAYATYAGLVLFPLLYPVLSIPGLSYVLSFHVLFGLFLTSFIQTATTDPGTVPPNWGFYMGDETKRRRYCKVCNIWKPDRTHHCSACGRCVLNMDHHCPWLNNCVGFMNRKFFIQLLIYGLLSLIIIVCHTTVFLIRNGPRLILDCPERSACPNNPLCKCALSVGGLAALALTVLMSLTLAIPLVPFTRFHIAMLQANSTTIESMDPATRDRRKYDIGAARNLQQVMGPAVLLWWLPCHTSVSRPAGDGVRWSLSYARAHDGSSDE